MCVLIELQRSRGGRDANKLDGDVRPTIGKHQRIRHDYNVHIIAAYSSQRHHCHQTTHFYETKKNQIQKLIEQKENRSQKIYFQHKEDCNITQLFALLYLVN